MRIFFTAIIVFIATATSFANQPDSLDIKIGQMIMIGINDRTSVSDSDPLLKELRDGKAGGIILFEKNITKTGSRENLKQMVQRMQANAIIPLFVAIDEEGGRVHRLKEKYGFPPMPSAAYLGELNNADSTLYYNRQLASLLSDLGINLNYAPVVDLAVNHENTVIVKNGRSFGADYQNVAKHASLAIQAHHEHGVKTALKHFPGHGSSTGDTHLGVVDVTDTWSLQELLPYEKIFSTTNYDGVMIGHMVNRHWDTAMLPATLSKQTIDLLRGLLGFKGVTFSDDMQMQAISDHYGLDKMITLSVNAGVDVLVFANTLGDAKKHVTATQVHAIIKKLVKNKKIPRARINEAYSRIMALKGKKTATK